jgi:hypothetical protein
MICASSNARAKVGVCLQHLGILIGRQAQAQVWPEIIAWIDSRV